MFEKKLLGICVVFSSVLTVLPFLIKRIPSIAQALSDNGDISP